MKKHLLFIALYIVVFATGLAGLVYQVTWHKYLSRLIGITRDVNCYFIKTGQYPLLLLSVVPNIPSSIKFHYRFL